MNPNFPIYIPSYSRDKTQMTMTSLDEMGVPYHIIVEPEQYEQYCKVFGREKVLTLPQKYHDEYDTCDNLGKAKSQGPGPARNFAWDHSIQHGYKWHWVMDDNIRGFYRFNNNRRILVNDGTIFKCMEDFVLRYENIAMAGPDYVMFTPDRYKLPPFITNTRIYSCNLIRNDVPYRWRGRYNEDTDLSLRMLKDGWCTVQFYAFLQNKINTQKVKGGNMERFYSREGTYPKSKMLKDLWPDFVKLVFKYNRWHHYIDYHIFKINKLIKKKDIDIKDSVNNYGMRLINMKERME